jgi:hypothetical protein
LILFVQQLRQIGLETLQANQTIQIIRRLKKTKISNFYF